MKAGANGGAKVETPKAPCLKEIGKGLPAGGKGGSESDSLNLDPRAGNGGFCFHLFPSSSDSFYRYLLVGESGVAGGSPLVAVPIVGATACCFADF